MRSHENGDVLQRQRCSGWENAVGGWLQKVLEPEKPAVLSPASVSAPPPLPSWNSSRKDFLSLSTGTPDG